MDEAFDLCLVGRANLLKPEILRGRIAGGTYVCFRVLSREVARVTLSRRELHRPRLLKAVFGGQLTNGQAAPPLGITLRQVRRLNRRFGRRAAGERTASARCPAGGKHIRRSSSPTSIAASAAPC